MTKKVVKYEIPKRYKYNRYRSKENNVNNLSMDSVYTRLYNDFEVRGGKQQLVKDKYSFYLNSKNNKINYNKFLNKKKISKNNSELLVTNFNKNNYFLDSQISINGGFLYDSRNNKNNKNKYRCIYCYYKKEKEKNMNNFKCKTIDNTTYPNNSTNDNSVRYYSKLTKLEPILTNESFISNYNNFQKRNILKYNEIVNESTLKIRNTINLKKFIKQKFNKLEEEKQAFRPNTLLEQFYNKNKISNQSIFNNYKNRNNNKKSFNFNKTINITGNKYKNFFNIDNIEEL